jgi:ribosomal protein S27AE
MKDYRKKWRDNNKNKTKAHRLLNRAIHNGAIKRKPCENCGEVKVEAHHDDYNKPLEVKWLCHQHHNELHYSRGI